MHKSIDANGNRFYPGDEFTFVITVANQGPQAANHVRVMDQLPEAVTFISAERIADSGPDPLVWYEAELASGASVSYRVTVRANTQLGTFENCAFVSSPNLDENLNNNSSCSQFFILERPAGNSNIRIGDRVWQDTNKNGVQDEGENGLAKVKVQLLSSPGGNLIAETTTDENGLYAFAQVAPGSYLLAFEHLKDYYFTLVDQGEDDKDSDADPVTGRTGSLTVAADQVDDRWDAGMVRREAPSQLDNSIGDRVWLDSNGNGVQEEGESGIEGIQVQLLSSPSATLVATTATNSEGLFSFVNVAPGNYLLAFSLLDGHHFTLVGQGDEATDSDAEITSGRTAAFSIAADENITGWDAGMTANDSPERTGIRIGDRIWLDTNKNGLQDEGEPGVPSATVNLLSDPSGTLVLTSLTDAEGQYVFENVPAGSYRLELLLPDNLVFTTADAGGDDIDSDADPATGRTAAFAVENGQQVFLFDIGLKQRTTSNLQVVKSIPDEHTYYYRNQQVTFLIRVTNQGPETAQNVRIIDTVPDGLTFISAAPSQTSGPNPLIWTVESMAVDETIEISVVMQSTEKLGGMDNCVMVSSSSLDPDLANNISCAQIHVLLPVELSSFSARSINNQVVLEWSTQSETENLGFHLLRSDTENGPYTQITQSMIQGAGTSSSLRNYQYQDLTASESKTYYYKLVDVDYNGRLSLHGPIDVTVALPTATVLEQNYPNPFNPTTKIRFILKEQGFAALTIYNVRGEKVRELVADQLNAGAHIVEWDGMDQYGRQAPSGMYLYTLRMNGFEQKRMMMFLK
ncbi:MAG: Serine-aspartate repeat-containing protein F precursor [bacterium ADurb.Bin478]|nr:MAG: Serine-aspartate repeat-containing protein F precursor [bacterium ADurb.Bin478]